MKEQAHTFHNAPVAFWYKAASKHILTVQNVQNIFKHKYRIHYVSYTITIFQREQISVHS